MGATPGLHGPSPGLLWGYPPGLDGSCVWSRMHAVPGPGRRTSAVGDGLAKELRMAGPTPVVPRIEVEVGPAHLEVDENDHAA